MATNANWLEEWLAERGLFGRTQEQEPANSFQPMPYRQTGPLRFAQVTNEPGEELPGDSPPSTTQEERDAALLGITQEEAEARAQTLLGQTSSALQDLRSALENQQREEAEKQGANVTAPTKGLFPGFELGLGKLGKTITEGAQSLFSSLGGLPDPLDPVTFANAGPWGMFGRAMNDPTLDTGTKIGAGIVGVGSLLGPFAPITMLGAALNSMGAYHSFDPENDKDLTLDINSGRLGWSGKDYFSNPEQAAARVGGIQYGSPNNLSTLLSAGDEKVNATYTTPDGTTLSGPVSAKTLAQEYATGVEGMFGRGPEALFSGSLGYDDSMDSSAGDGGYDEGVTDEDDPL